MNAPQIRTEPQPVVVCVDDEETILVALRDQLRRGLDGDFLIETTDGGEDALELIEELTADGHDIPLLITDQIMPGMHGHELLEQVTEKSPATMNILLTGQASIEDLGHAVNRAKLYRYLAKPWQKEDLVLTANEALAHYFLERRVEQQRLELQASNEALLKADQLKDEFLANTSHELRTPLHGMIGLAQALLDRTTSNDAAAQHDLQLMVQSGKRLSRLVNDILDFGQLRRQSLELTLRPIDVASAVDVVLALHRTVASDRVALLNRVPRDLPPIDGDEDRIIQILHNVLGNAVKFTSEGEITVDARLSSSRSGAGDEAAAMVALEIADTGIGLDPETARRVFEPFEQGDGSIARTYGGTGLGLPITRALVELHGGRIDVHSEGVGHGSRFVIELPVSSRGADRAQDLASRSLPANSLLDPQSEVLSGTVPEAAASTAVETSPEIAGNVVVLVVDDDPVNRRVISRYLERPGYHIHEAGSGAEALQLIDGGMSPDLVLLDVMMPQMSGYKVCEELRRRFPANEVPVILVTARAQVQDLVEGLQVGANDYLTKPVSKSELLARMKAHVQNARMSVAAGRFVPREFLRILGHETLVDVSRGDHLEQDMSILFSDIRAFTTLVEGKSPDESFAFINEYLAHMEPSIREHGGFIDSFEGDAIMALFQRGGADGALRAGIGNLRALQAYNRARVSRGERTLSVGIGVNSGRLMLGTIGGRNRLKCGVIGDPVNLAARVESMTKQYGASMMCSESTLDQLSDRSVFDTRLLDRVVVVGKTKPVAVYEVLDGLPDEERQAKLEARDAFSQGLELFRRGDMNEALDCFTDLARRIPGDKAVHLYVERCSTFIRDGLPEDWSGVIELARK